MAVRHFMMWQSFAMATPLSPRVMTKLWQNMGSAKPCDGLISKSLSSARDCFEQCLGFELCPMGKLWPVMRAVDVPCVLFCFQFCILFCLYAYPFALFIFCCLPVMVNISWYSATRSPASVMDARNWSVAANA